MSYLNGQNINKLAFEQCFFGLLKLLYRYHNKGLVLNSFSVNI